MQRTALTPAWQKLTTVGGVIQGNNAYVYMGSTAPGAASPGITLTDNIPVYIPRSVYTEIWVRGSGYVTYTA